MYKLFLAFALFILMFSGMGCHSSENKQATSSADSISVMRQRLSDSVKQEFSYAWENYVKYAWGHDALKPLSHSYHDWYPHSLLMTPLDGYDTMVLMGLTSKADSAKQLILDSLHFNYNMSVSNFEITIRMLGGLLSAYELNGDKQFLNLATDLADRLIKAYHSPTGMPYRFVNLMTGETTGDTSNPAEAGSSLLEYGTLTKLTDDSIYYKTAKKAVVTLFNLRNKKTGLVGDTINVNTGKWIGKESSISSGTDSYYEYLLKAWKLFGNQDCKRMWDSSIIAINKHLADTVNGTLWYGHANMDTGIINLSYYGALDAFFGGALALDGDTTRAKSLQESNFKMWKLAGLEPEVLNYLTMQIVNGYYALRPENLESCYYLYHYTHNPKYLNMARVMFQSIVRYCRKDNGYTVIKDVRNMVPGDMMESFFLAETLKYSYLIFAPAKTLDFNKIIFNTEAHPLTIK